MKTLFLIRHAHARPLAAGRSDHDRTLDERGLRDAQEMGRRLRQRGVDPDLVITSPAVRARTTAQLLTAELGVAPQQIRVDPRLYASSAEKLLYIVQELDDGAGCVMLVGHNPEMTEVAQHLSRDIQDMPTAAVARFDFNVRSWSAVGPGQSADATFDFPDQDSGDGPSSRR